MTTLQPTGMPGTQDDPFTTAATPQSILQSQRTSAGDSPSAFLSGSPAQARRVLEAHIADTDRRINDTSRLGTTLLDQRKQLSERLRDVEKQQGNHTISPELQQRLTDLEQEWTQIGHETGHAFIPRNRLLNEDNEVTGTPTVFGGDARATPARLSVPARNKRTTSSNRVHDIEFATEISTSLLAQVRSLQAVIAEKEEALRKAHSDNTLLQSHSDTFQARLRNLDDDEEKFKDENWNLETQVQDLSVQIREALGREEKLTQLLTATKAEKMSAQREYEDIKQSHDRLSDDHAALQKHHDTELNGLRYNVASLVAVRESMHKQIEELTSQNQELARAVAYRIKADDAVGTEGHQAGKFNDEDDVTPETSPPPSPTKATPRHGGLEHETLKSSLTHAHRMIQNLKNNIHREKTEKLELRRMLQETRDELEARQVNAGLTANGARKSKQAAEFKKPTHVAKLGGRKEASEEIWEEYEQSPTRRSFSNFASSVQHQGSMDTSDTYATATEHSDAYATANEKDNSTETDAFATAESVNGDNSDDLTETEDGPSRSRNVVLSTQNRPQNVNRNSFLSTASDEELPNNTMTPPNNHLRYKIRLNRGLNQTSDSPQMQDSPASFASTNSQKVSTMDLAAELGDFDDDDSIASNTPSRSLGPRQLSPEIVRSLASHSGSPLIQAKSALAMATAIKAPNTKEVGTMTEPNTLLRQNNANHTTDDTGGVNFGSFSRAPTGAGFGNPRNSLDTSAKSGEAPGDDVAAPVPNRTIELDGTTQPAGAASEIMPKLQPLSISNIEAQQTFPLLPIMSKAVIPGINTETPPVPSANESRQRVMGAQDSKLRDIFTISIEGRDVKSRKQRPLDEPFKSRTVGSSGPAILEDRYNISKGDVENNDVQEPILNIRDLTQDRGDHNRSPLRAVSGNTPDRRQQSLDKSANAQYVGTASNTNDEGSQTSLSAEQIEKMMKDRNRATGFISPSHAGSPSVTNVSSPGRNSKLDANSILRSAGSAAGLRRDLSEMPPLPQDARETIAAASRPTSSHRVAPFPAITSAVASQRQSQQPLRPRTPSLSNRSLSNSQSPLKATGIRACPPVVAQNGNEEQQRRDSVSSFASELDERFNMPTNGQIYGHGYDVPGTDPRMIAAITQTMIGEFLWKYTRKPGRGELSENRHRRFFWIHPYTRTLYWSNQDPGAAGRAELKAKSVPIEAVRVISDDNIVPPGLHSKSIIVVTPGRSIKFTAPTSNRHETWFNALSYLLLRGTGDQRQEVHQAPAVTFSHERTTTMSSIDSIDLGDSESSRRTSSRLTTHSHRSTNSASNATRTTNAPNFSYRAPSPQGVRPPHGHSSRASLIQTARASSSASNRTSAIQAQRAAMGSGVASDSRGEVAERATSAGEFKKPALPQAPAQIPTLQSTPRKSSSATSMTGTPNKSNSFASRISNSLNSIGRRGRQDSRAQDEERRRELAMEEAMEHDTYQHYQHTSGLSSQQHTPRKVENVRACCEGKHDVGHLHHRSTSRAASIASAGRRSLSLMGSRTQLGDSEH